MSEGSADTRAVLARLAQDVDADRGVRLYVDRGDGVLELAAAVTPEGSSGGLPASTLSQRLRRWTGRLAGAIPGATTRLALPEARDGYLELERSRREPFTEADLAIARMQARRLVVTVSTRLGPRPIAWSAQLDAVQSVAAQLTRLSSVEAVSAALCTQTHRVVRFDNARVYVLNEDGRTLDAVASGRMPRSTRVSRRRTSV
jgi:hypothetical protein